MSTPCCQILTAYRLVVSKYEVPKVLDTFCRFKTISVKLKAQILVLVLVVESFSALLSKQKLFRMSTISQTDRQEYRQTETECICCNY